MDKIWYRNPSKSEVIGRCGGDEKTEWPRRTDKKSNAKKNVKKINLMNKNKGGHDGSQNLYLSYLS